MTDEACAITLKSILTSPYHKLDRAERTALIQAIDNMNRMIKLKEWIKHPDQDSFQLSVDTFDKRMGFNPYQE